MPPFLFFLWYTFIIKAWCGGNKLFIHLRFRSLLKLCFGCRSIENYCSFEKCIKTQKLLLDIKWNTGAIRTMKDRHCFILIDYHKAFWKIKQIKNCGYLITCLHLLLRIRWLPPLHPHWHGNCCQGYGLPRVRSGGAGQDVVEDNHR